MNPNLNEINLYKTNLDSFKREIYNLLQEMIITDIHGISIHSIKLPWYN